MSLSICLLTWVVLRVLVNLASRTSADGAVNALLHGLLHRLLDFTRKSVPGCVIAQHLSTHHSHI